MSAARFWCQACAAYGESACPTAGHRSEQMLLVGRTWKRYSPPRIFERAADGTVWEVNP